MMGTGTFAEPTLRALLDAGETVVGLVTQPDRSGGKVRGSTRQTGEGMAAIAARHGVPVAQPESVNTPEGVAALTGFAPDLLVVAAYGQILKPEVLAVPPRGAINVHASLLPKYRGASPVAHAILNGEAVTGVTIIRITLGLDAGEMLSQATVPIPPRTTTGALEAELAAVGAGLCLDAVRRITRGPVVGEVQDPKRVTRAPKFTKEMGAIDWTQPATRVASHIYAVQPWPTAYTFLQRPGKAPLRLIVTEAAATDIDLSPGSLRTDGQRLYVGCGTGAVELLEVQPAGKKRMTATEFLRGTPLVGGSRLGPEAGAA
jgi:methionyl-tRNA formyltransferase